MSPFYASFGVTVSIKGIVVVQIWKNIQTAKVRYVTALHHMCARSFNSRSARVAAAFSCSSSCAAKRAICCAKWLFVDDWERKRTLGLCRAWTWAALTVRMNPRHICMVFTKNETYFIRLHFINKSCYWGRWSGKTLPTCSSFEPNRTEPNPNWGQRCQA